MLLGRQLEQLDDVDHGVLGEAEPAELLGRRRIALNRSAKEGNLATGGHAGVDDLLDAMDVGRETRRHHPPASIADDVSYRLAQGALGGYETRAFGVGGIRQEQPDPLTTQRRQRRKVGRTVVDRAGVKFEVAGVKHDPFRGVEGNRGGIRNRVGDVDERKLERLDLDRPARFDWTQIASTPSSSMRPRAISRVNLVP